MVYLGGLGEEEPAPGRWAESLGGGRRENRLSSRAGDPGCGRPSWVGEGAPDCDLH
jgi:hypothetical protein